MNKEEYKLIVKKYTPSEERLKNMLYAFLSGGVIGIIGVVLYQLFIGFNVSVDDAPTYVIVSIILISSILTGIGKFDNLVSKFKCGIIIPISGFAHSVVSTVVDSRRDGLITGMGSSVFKLAGSVILYGVVSAFVLTIIKVVFYG